MLKKTKGYLLLTLLVLTGLAGRIHSHTLSGTERRYLIHQLKTTNSDLISSVDGLSPRQLNFRPGPRQSSIRDLLFQAASLERAIEKKLRTTMAQPARIHSYRNRDDQWVINLFLHSAPPSPVVLFQNTIPDFSNSRDAIETLVKERNNLVRFTRTTTDDVRNFSVIINNYNIDLYQLLLLNTAYLKNFNDQINKIKSHPSFPG